MFIHPYLLPMVFSTLEQLGKASDFSLSLETSDIYFICLILIVVVRVGYFTLVTSKERPEGFRKKIVDANESAKGYKTIFKEFVITIPLSKHYLQV